jgi:hypothetical protein
MYFPGRIQYTVCSRRAKMVNEIVRLLGSILPGSSLLQTAAAVD